MTPPRRRVLFVDLDGTLVLDNSFHRFLLALWRRGGVRVRLDLVMAALDRVVRRSGSRLRMKRRVLVAFSRASERRRAAVVDEVLTDLLRTVSAPVLAEVERWRGRGAVIVLATAAPDCYAVPLAERLGLDDVIATPAAVDDGWREVLGTVKRDACLSWLRSRGMSGAEVGVITDHLDDAPLIASSHVAWFQGGQQELQAVRDAASCPQLALIDVEAEQVAGGLWLWFDDQRSGPHDVWEVRTILSKHRYALLYVGRGQWRRVRPGDALDDAVLRVDCPRPPSTRARLEVASQRRAVRDRLGVFH